MPPKVASPPTQEKPRRSGVFFLAPGRQLPAGAGLVTPTFRESDAVLPRPDRVDPGKLAVVIRVRPGPLKVPGTVENLAPFIAGIVDENGSLPPVFA